MFFRSLSYQTIMTTTTNQAHNSNSNLTTNPYITDDWNGGYRLVVDLTAELSASDWSLNFDLPGTIREAYGVELIDHDNGSYSISAQGEEQNLNQNQTAQAILIIDDYGQDAVTPQFSLDNDNQLMGSAISEPFSAPASSEANSLPTEPQGNQLDVDQDFGGNLNQAVAAAQDGDTLKLGNRTYYTQGVYIDRDITLQGSQHTIIDGMNTSGSIIEVGPGASGATFSDFRLTHGNNGLTGDGAHDLTINNLHVAHIGVHQPNRHGNNNIGIGLSHADGLNLSNSTFDHIGRKAVGVGDTVGATIQGLKVHHVNLAAHHAQSHDAAGIKLFNTHQVVIADNYLSHLNANGIWNDTTNATTIEGNYLENVGQDFLAPQFNTNVELHGIYNEKSANSVVSQNAGTANEGFQVYNSTEFTEETVVYQPNNDFESVSLGTTDYWVNEAAEREIALVENPDAANFELFAQEYNAQLI